MSSATHNIEIVALADSVLLPIAEKATGLTVKAMRRKIDDGVWVAGQEYDRGPDGHIYVSISGFISWVRSGRASKSGKRASA
jgi:hypothetical protein